MNVGMQVGILGGGQLARMLALAGHPLGISTRVLDPSPEAPAANVARHILGAYDDPAALAKLAEGTHVVTYEFENVPAATARRLAERTRTFPPPEALAVGQDRYEEKSLFRRLGIPTAEFLPVGSRDELHAAAARLGLPAVLKTRRLGYDGKGQFVVRIPSELDQAYASVGSGPLILEAFVPFERELSVIGVRGVDGRQAFYPLIENRHEHGILRVSRAPAPGVGAELHASAVGIARRIMETLGYVGVLAVELFQVGAGVGAVLLANELAPRVHNSGHWTIEGARTSQFENHMRAICGLPLGVTEPIGLCAMVNLIGALPDPAEVLAIPGAHLHLYMKSPRPGRKLGHVTIHAEHEPEIAERVARVLAIRPKG